MPVRRCALGSPTNFAPSVSWGAAMLLPVLGLCLTGSAATAGPNAGGVLVVHAANVVYTSTATSYMGLSGVSCGQDEGGANQDCPFYEPPAGRSPVCRPRRIQAPGPRGGPSIPAVDAGPSGSDVPGACGRDSAIRSPDAQLRRAVIVRPSAVERISAPSSVIS